MIFQERIIDALKQTPLKQKEIAEKCGIHPSCLTQYKKGESEPTLTTLFALCKVLNVSADYLLGLSEI